MKKYLSLAFVCVMLFTMSATAYADDANSTYIYNGEVIAVPVEDNSVVSANIQLAENHTLAFSVAQVNGMVYADAHGAYTSSSNGNTVSSYGMYVSFTVANSSISIANGNQFTAYHNASTSGYTANYEKSITGESTSSCTAKTIFTLTNSSNTQIKINLVIDSQGNSTVYFNGNYTQHNSDFDLN